MPTASFGSLSQTVSSPPSVKTRITRPDAPVGDSSESPQSLRLAKVWVRAYEGWADVDRRVAVETAFAFTRWLRHVEAGMTLRLAGRSGKPSGARRHKELLIAFLAKVEVIVDAGLERREGKLIEPVMPVPGRPELLDDYIAWETIKLQLGLFPIPKWESGSPKTSPLSICDGCSVVFRPRRKAAARWCPLCQHKRPAPSLGRVKLPTSPGETVQVRSVKSQGHVLTGWGVRTIGLCTECEQLMIGSANRRRCDRCDGRANT
jgi:hypothetical protein